MQKFLSKKINSLLLYPDSPQDLPLPEIAPQAAEHKKPQTILIVSSIFSPHTFGGAEIAACNRAQLLVQKGYNVNVVTLREKNTPRAWGKLMPEGYRLYRIRTPRRYTLYERTKIKSRWAKLLWHYQDYFDDRNLNMIGAVLDNVKPDHIYIDNIVGFGFNALAEIGRRNVPVSYVLHDLNLACFNTGMIRNGKTCARQCSSCRALGSLRQRNLKKIARLGFVSPSRSTLERARKYVPAVNACPAFVIRNVPEGVPPVQNRSEADHIRLIFAGRLDPVKGIGFLLEILEPLSRTYKFHLHVLGTGPNKRELKDRYGEQGWVTFHGFVPKSEVGAALAQSDLCCVPSLVEESYGLVTSQSLQLGTPVIGSKSGGTAELVRDRVTGALIPPGDAEAWTRAFTAIFENPDMIKEWQKNCLLHTDEYDRDKVAQAYEDCLRALHDPGYRRAGLAEKQSLRILHVVRQYHPAVGGLESYVKNMIAHQQNLGHECTVLTLSRVFYSKKKLLPAYEMIDGVPVHRVPYIGFRRFFIPFFPHTFLKGYDIIHVHNTDGFFDRFALIAGFIKRPVFATTHGGFFHTARFSTIKKFYFRFITGKLSRKYKAVFATSSNDYETFKGVNDNLLLKPNAVLPLGNFIAKGEDFVYLGRLSKNKNITALIETFAHLKSDYGLDARLHIIGPEWDVKQSELAALAWERGLEDRVVLHGFLAPEDMQSVLKNCGWFVSASRFEGFGMSMVEAMSIGLIPYVHPNDSFRELIAAGGVGACVDFSRPREASVSIAEHMKGVSLEDRVKAQDFALQFSWDKLAEETVSFYREYGS